MINTVLNDRYLILDHIGGGGMADVYKAKDQRLERLVAIKVLKDQFTDDENFVKGFTRESHAAARLNHPDIVGVYDVGLDNSNGKMKYYIVMELINGYTLKDKLKKEKRLDVEESVDYILTISRALKHAHDNGIIHRDVKPQNILLQDNKYPKVTDFGIAQGATKATVAGGEDILGSVHYFSPEQASGRQTDERSDIYSLGIVFYEILTGQLPYNGDTPIAIALKHIQNEMPRPSKYNPNVSESLDAVVLKMTNKDPDDRYSNLEELIRDLEAVRSNLHTDLGDTLILPSDQINQARKTYDQKNRVRRTRTSHRQNTNGPSQDYEKAPKKKNRSGGFFSILLGIILALVLVGLAFNFLIRRQVNNQEEHELIEVPNLIGINVDVARRRLENLGLNLLVEDTSIDENYDVDDILEQNPLPNSEVEEGDTIRVVINTEEEDIRVKNYVGMAYSEVSAQVVSDGLILGDPSYEEVERESDIGKVLEQDLRPGTVVAPKSIISFTVGKAKEVETISLPSLIGQSLENAIAVLEDKNLRYNVTEAESDRFRPGTVMSQSPDAGASVEEGSLVNIVVVVEPEDDPEESNEGSNSSSPTNPITLSIKLPDIGEETLHVRIDRLGPSETTQVYSGFHAPGEGTLNVPVDHIENSVFHIFIDDELVGTYP